MFVSVSVCLVLNLSVCVYYCNCVCWYVCVCVTSEILIKSALNLASVRFFLFLTLIRNLFESTFGNKVAPSSE